MVVNIFDLRLRAIRPEIPEPRIVAGEIRRKRVTGGTQTYGERPSQKAEQVHGPCFPRIRHEEFSTSIIGLTVS